MKKNKIKEQPVAEPTPDEVTAAYKAAHEARYEHLKQFNRLLGERERNKKVWEDKLLLAKTESDERGYRTAFSELAALGDPKAPWHDENGAMQTKDNQLVRELLEARDKAMVPLFALTAAAMEQRQASKIDALASYMNGDTEFARSFVEETRPRGDLHERLLGLRILPLERQYSEFLKLRDEIIASAVSSPTAAVGA